MKICTSSTKYKSEKRRRRKKLSLHHHIISLQLSVSIFLLLSFCFLKRSGFKIDWVRYWYTSSPVQPAVIPTWNMWPHCMSQCFVVIIPELHQAVGLQYYPLMGDHPRHWSGNTPQVCMCLYSAVYLCTPTSRSDVLAGDSLKKTITLCYFRVYPRF